MTPSYALFMAQAQNPLVRDLAWAIASPALLNAAAAEFADKVVSDPWCEQQFEQFKYHLVSLEVDPSPLATWIQDRKSQRLGRYFESLVGYWLHHAPGFTDVTESLKVKKEKITVGEFDFLYRDKTSPHHVHLEVAVKFYLRHGSGESWKHYLGPEGRETMDQKLRLLFDKQLLLSTTPEGQEALAHRAPHKSVMPVALVKGAIFDPWTPSEFDPPYPTPGLSHHRLGGWWVHLDKAAEVVQHKPNRTWMILPKLEWLAPRLCERQKANRTLTGPALLETVHHLFKTSHTPQLIAELSEYTGHSRCQEISRGFIVP